jgi:hypothetical protein
MFDGAWVYDSKLENLVDANDRGRPNTSADIVKIHVKSRKVVHLTRQVFTHQGDRQGLRTDGFFRLGRRHVPCATGLRSTPRPSISTSTTSPPLRYTGG